MSTAPTRADLFRTCDELHASQRLWIYRRKFDKSANSYDVLAPSVPISKGKPRNGAVEGSHDLFVVYCRVKGQRAYQYTFCRAGSGRRYSAPLPGNHTIVNASTHTLCQCDNFRNSMNVSRFLSWRIAPQGLAFGVPQIYLKETPET